jgi:cytochrome c biogenesis protein CcdA/thiol-disulfide isomerase/thioredoxin
MELLILFAFLAGIVTIVSPCVLPVLPILLSTSSGGGRFRPVGIVLGLAITFAVVTLGVTAAAQALAIPATWLRIISIVLLGVFGLTLLIPALGELVERFLSPLTRLGAADGKQSGFGGGLLIGAGLGFLWAPCVGPIMASVIGLTATSGLTPQAAGITLAYSLGAALPMLILAYAGRGLAARAHKLGPHTNRIKQAFGALTVVACLALFLGADTALQTFTLNSLPPGYSSFLQSFERGTTVEAELDKLQSDAESGQTAASVPQPENTPTIVPPALTAIPEPTMTATPKPGIALKDMGLAPELTGTTDWINSDPLKLSDLRGKVVIVNFWTFGCYNCVNTLPYVKDLYARYHDQGLEIVGVHTPEFAYEHLLSNVQSHSKELGVTWPVVQDNDYKTWRAYNNRYWPAFYFLDAEGHIRYTHFGEGNYDTNEKVVQQLLEEAKSAQ